MGFGSWVREKWNNIKSWFSEREERRRNRLREQYYRYERQKMEELSSIYNYRNNAFSSIDNEYREAEQEQKRQLIERRKEINKSIYNNIAEMVQEQIDDNDELIKEIHEILGEIKNVSKVQQNTYIRAKSIERLRDDIYETMAKLNAYKYYLKNYKKRRLDYVYDKSGEIAEMFEFKLPENSLYDGKLIYIKKCLLNSNGTLKINESMDTKYSCKDLEAINDFDENADVAVMSTKGESYTYELSCTKGLFKSMAIYQPRVGIEAVVDRYENRNIILKYYNLELCLQKKNLSNPRKIPPRGAQIRVYPYRYKSNLSTIPEVTEKVEHSLNSINIGTIPLIIPNNKITEFLSFIKKNNLEETDLEWKISPYDENALILDKELKFQLGNQFVFKVLMDNKNDNQNYLRYDEILDNKHLIKAEDIFIDLDMNFKIYPEKAFLDSMELQEKFEDFILFINNEFSEQKNIRESVEGVAYYNKWAEITNKLIEYLYKGKPLKCDILSIDILERKDYKSGLTVFKAELDNADEILKILDAHYDNRATEYFIECDKNRYVVEFSKDASFIYIYGEFKMEYLESCSYKLNVYPKAFPYPEITQKNALNVFREGRLANGKLKTFLLDGTKIEYSYNGDTVEKFFDKDIEKNKAQKEAVLNAIGEKNIFMIQGPPGTGKTKVIKEIIKQHLYKYPYDKILMVSQANIAVDNVLKGLVEGEESLIDKENIIRCGTDKYNKNDAPDCIKPILFETKKAEYIKAVKETKFLDKEKEDDRLEWLNILEDPNEASLVGECILKNNQLIGATCVGLEKKKLGLNELIFDLVIIDEAGKTLPGEILIPINRAKKVILVGDHKQLPPVVNPALYDDDKCDTKEILEDDEKDDFLNESFFKRLYESCPNSNKVMLNIQFRMPTSIGTMISKLFYEEEKLLNGNGTENKEPIIFDTNLNIIDMSKIKSYRERKDINSGPYNEKECMVVYELIKYIRSRGYNDRIVVITPYKNQKRHLNEIKKKNDLKEVEINTIDAFQGDEEKIIIYCTTRAYTKTDYFSYASRLNVALSRAQNEVIIIGSLKYFESYGEDSNLYKIGKYIQNKGDILEYHNNLFEDEDNYEKTIFL